ncbi:unnamed protein product [Citrullus colocynthis]|uniref:Uncharacterized protein n=1 Tax=Citrullus colocynthis TaxID=252529 RepID=A0ABP0XUL2_9ROSI
MLPLEFTPEHRISRCPLLGDPIDCHTCKDPVAGRPSFLSSSRRSLFLHSTLLSLPAMVVSRISSLGMTGMLPSGSWKWFP